MLESNRRPQRSHSDTCGVSAPAAGGAKAGLYDTRRRGVISTLPINRHAFPPMLHPQLSSPTRLRPARPSLSHSCPKQTPSHPAESHAVESSLVTCPARSQPSALRARPSGFLFHCNTSHLTALHNTALHSLPWRAESQPRRRGSRFAPRCAIKSEHHELGFGWIRLQGGLHPELGSGR